MSAQDLTVTHADDIHFLILDHRIENILDRVERLERMLLQAAEDGNIHIHINSPGHNRPRGRPRTRPYVGGNV